MFSMKTFFCLVILILTAQVGATEKPYFLYGDIQAMGGYPMVGMGVRSQKGIHAFDFAGNACPLNQPSSFAIFHLRSLYILNPEKTNFYVGAGLGMLNEPETIGISGSFESALGYQWKNRIFAELNAIVPFKTSDSISPVWPGLTLGFGF